MLWPISGDSTASSAANPINHWQSQAAAAAPAPSVAKEAPLTGDKAIEHIKATGQYESLGAAITAARYAVRTNSSGARTALSAGGTTEELADKAVRAPSQTPAATAANPAHGIVSTFTPEGLRLRVRTREAADAPALTSDWRLESLGYGVEQMPVPAGELRVTGQRAEIIRRPSASGSARWVPQLTEWFQNTPGGLEHGFILAERPVADPCSSRGHEALDNSEIRNQKSEIDQSLLTSAATGSSEQLLRLVISVSGDLAPHAVAGGQRLGLRDADGRTVLGYEKLKVWDATGAGLPATMETGKGQVTLAVNDATARYPLTIDPTFIQQTTLMASDPHALDHFGSSVGISGDTVVVGAPTENSVTGFPDPLNGPGAAYVFRRDEGGLNHWGEIKKLTASDAQADDHFGRSVGIDGDLIVVGASDSHLEAEESIPLAGAAYVFARNQGGENQWGEVKKLTASVRQDYARFGDAVAISGDTIVVGAPVEETGRISNPGAVHVFARSQGGADQWGEVRELTASDAESSDSFGDSVGISGDTIVVGAPGIWRSNGKAYVFGRNQGGADQWGEIKKLTSSDPVARGNFGNSVGIDVDTIVVGAKLEKSGISTGAGAAYVYRRDHGGPNQWGEIKRLATSDARGVGFFGFAVAIRGDSIVVGDPWRSSRAGATHVYGRNLGGADQWNEVQRLTASDARESDGFGYSIGISDAGIVVGAQDRDSAALSDAGGAYVFRINPAGGITTTISPPGPIQVGDTFTVTFSINGYLAPTEIDWFHFQVSHPSAMFSFVPGSVTINDASGPDENWLRLAPQDGVGPGALPISGSALPRFGAVDISLSDSRPGSTRGTAAESGFLVSFRLHANSVGTGGIMPSAAPDGTVLLDVDGTPAGVPVFSGASVRVLPANPGQFTGQVDMVGETEVAVPRSVLVPATRVRAQNGPSGASEEVFLPWPYWGAFTLDGLTPSGSVLPEQGYEVGASMNFRTGRRLETFTSPFLGQGLNPWKIVPADGTVDLGTTFVMQPGFVRGAILLQGPAESLLGHPSTLRYIARLTDFDPDGDGYLDINPDGDSRVSAAGRDVRAAGAIYSADGAKAFVSFEGEFDPATSAFRGDYDLVLAGLNGQGSWWRDLGLQLLLQSGFPDTPETYVRQKLRITEQRNPQYNNLSGIEVAPASITPVDLNYCLSEVVIEVETVFGTIWNPTVTVFNSGLNLSSPVPEIRSYRVNLDNATGTPTTRGENSRGRIVLLLPEGDYDFRVTAQAGNSPADTVTQDFDPFRLKVGCGERLRVSPVTMQVQIESTTACGPGGLARVDGTVLAGSGINVRRIEWSTPGGEPHVLCDDLFIPCGAFSFDLPAPSDVCAGTPVTVTAYTMDGLSASSTRLIRDTVPPVIRVGADKTVECGSTWEFDPVTAVDACSGVVPVGVVGADVTTPLGPCSRTVVRTWQATDACGNTAQARQQVTVVDTMAPTIHPPLQPALDCPQRVRYFVTAEDNCGPITLTYSPPEGSFFPVGTTEVVATAVDGCGLRTVRRFQITVLGDCATRTSQGLPVLPFGNAIIDGRTDGSLRLSALGGAVQGGLRLDPGEVAGLRVEFDRFLPAEQLAGGAEFTAIARGVSGATVAALRLVRGATFAVFEVIPSFGLPGTPEYGVRFYIADRLSHESVGRTAPPPNQFPIRNQLFLSDLPATMRVVVRPGGVVVYECSFGEPRNVSIYTSGNALNISADRMEIFSSGAGVAPVELLSGLDLAFSGISERIITGMAITKFGQEIRASQGVAMAGVQDGLAVGYVNFPGLTNPPAPGTGPFVWNTANPLGYFGDSLPGNPSHYRGYWESVNPLGHAAEWDLKIDLTDNASAPLGLPMYRAGKSSAELTLALHPFPADARLRVMAGGVAAPNPGALTVEMGALVLEGKAGRVELGAEFKSPSGPLRQQLEVTLADGSVRTFEGTAEGLRVSWDPPVTMPVAVSTEIGPEGALSMGLGLVVGQGAPAGGGIQAASSNAYYSVRLPNATEVQATAMAWKAQGGQTWTPGSLRGLLLMGNDDPPVILTGLTTSTNNPTPASYFAGHRVSPLGNGTFRIDAFGSLALGGLTQSGEDGVAIKNFTVHDAALPSPGSLRLNLGYLPFWSGLYPPAGARLDLRLLSEGNPVPNAVLAGQSYSSAGSPLFFGVRFPNLQGTNHTLRVFRGNTVVFDRSGRLNDPPTARGNLAPYSLPDGVEARLISGRFTWVLTWNRTIGMEIYNQPFANPFLGDRVEIAADDGTAYAGGENTLEVRAGSIGTLRLLNLGNRNAPSVPALNFSVDAGRLNLNWDEVASGRPRLQTAPHVNGPWQNLTLGVRTDGIWDNRFELVPTGEGGYARLITRAATDGCLEFSAATPGDHPNPADFAGWKFERFDPIGVPSPLNEIIELDGSRGLKFDARMDLELPLPAEAVDILFGRSGGIVTFIAFDATGEVARKVVNPRPSGGGAEAETIEAPAGRPLRRLRVLSAGGSVDLREFCLRAFPFQDAAQSRSCLPLRTAAPGPTPNPWIQGDLTLTTHTADGATPATGLISLYQNNLIVGYDVPYQAELKFAHACPRVEIEFISGSGSIDFQAYDDLGTALPVYHLGRVTSSYGETAVFPGSPRPIARVVITSPAGTTRLMKICCGPVPVPFCREVDDITVRPTRNPQPAGDILWTFYDAAHVLTSSMLHTNGIEVGLDLTPETVIDFATDQLSVELRIVVDTGGATMSADATAPGGSTVGSLPSTSYAAGVHTLRLVDTCGTCGLGARIRLVRVRLTGGNAIVTRVYTPFPEEN